MNKPLIDAYAAIENLLNGVNSYVKVCVGLGVKPYRRGRARAGFTLSGVCARGAALWCDVGCVRGGGCIGLLWGGLCLGKVLNICLPVFINCYCHVYGGVVHIMY